MSRLLKSIVFLFLLLLPFLSSAQELKAKVAINTDRLGTVDKQQFAELERQLSDMLNNTRWTNAVFSPNERIECNFALNLLSVEDESKYQAELYVTAQRPVYNASYQSPLLVYRDRDVNFEYQSFDVVEYNSNQISSNLVATMVFYAYFILALDFDSFSLQGGNIARTEMRQLVNSAGQTNADWKGWKAYENDYNRYAIAEALNDPRQEPFRKFWYAYHRKGLDELVANVQRGRTSLLESLKDLELSWQGNSLSPLLMLVSQTKLQEIVQIAKEATPEEKQAAYKLLSKIYPTEGNVLDALKR
ncbi:hypothetical protein HQ36_01370 [Porphyromonas gingivicanis]|uniref:DUF4835 domain-containing protein n=1 Tax=Porphyromonas gingivicanis TaxID=266762 RepID=A0A0A2G9M4_9PORP|nr:DUF4835 family protein [Porphyromonas gingivicanis]KGN99137.1 hypothetical protein HQ36_01370 [Porphyromonas gingivicanis]